MLNTESIKELVPAVGLRLKFQSAFANLIPASKTITINPIADDDDGDDDGDDVCEEVTVQTTDNSLKAGKLDEEFVREHSKIFGHKNPTAKLTDWQNTVNVSALQIAMEYYNLLYYRGLLKLRAEEKARETYVFKKKSGSRSRKLDGESNPKRPKVSQEDRRGKITELSTEIELLKKQIATKQNIISKANTVKDFQLCDKTQTELRSLLKEKGKCEKQLAEVQKKEAKSNWYHKVKSINESRSTTTSAKKVPPLRAVQAQSMDIRKLFSLRASSAQPTTSKATETTSSVQTNDNLPETADTEIITVSSISEAIEPPEKGNSAQATTIKATKTTSSVQAKDDMPATTTTVPQTKDQESLGKDSAPNEVAKNVLSNISVNEVISNVSNESIAEESFLG